ncbi:inorganic phosphate transporter [Desulfobulbus oligotrophicus]|jgi:PiT family inorganic phosphate transporter|uniref:Inorganic phosphate transporter n=1 Tax=Desulfobulbus oligotrophicus TaxID=1909699 RepID=A0A7T5VDZ4_9BACT|nr:inorganic phosphate transporter [Desulfobulbus oligotrophicus]MDY0391008.1 inorganic phosphate transporter [Desulfobulbus oligotrophicus]QQG66190.1 inorganic phosphate transporter [Desulfobulbus oligotrophicus]
MITALLILVIFAALVFEYINGFHDSANSIATVVSTKVLTARVAVIYAGCFEVIGAFLGTHVANTIGQGIITAEIVTQGVILCALLSAIIWNLVTWYYGIPSSSSHALIGGLMGAGIAKAGWEVILFDGVTKKILMPMVTSPMFGFGIGFVFMVIILWTCARARPNIVNKWFRKLQLVSAGIMALSHGSNDAQKTMGIITLALVSNGLLDEFKVPTWVILSCAVTMGLGTMAGGWRIIRTMGSKMIKLKPVHGFAAETSAAAVILTASHFGIPVSTTHIISTSIMGVGSTRGANALKLGIVGNIVLAWVLTIPVCMFIATILYRFLPV